jgi:FMN reductase
MKLLIISCSLSPSSHSAVMAQRLAEECRSLGAETELVDLRTLPLPFCDGYVAYNDANVAALAAKIEAASVVALAVPIYNFDVGGAARNLIAMTGAAWNDKIVGLIGAAEGQRSYMSLMPLANSLMLDFRCVIIPRYVYASRQSFENSRLNDPAIAERLAGLAQDLRRFAEALAPAGFSSAALSR